MIDFAIIFVLYVVIGALTAALLRRKDLALSRRVVLTLQGPLFLVGALIIAQMLMLLFRSSSTVLSMGSVIAPFLQILDSVFVLLMVTAVVALGIYLSFRQFDLWEKSRSRLLELTDELLDHDAATLKTWSEILGGDLTSSFKVAAGGVTVITPLIGAGILALSLFFLYMFLKIAYPLLTH